MDFPKTVAGVNLLNGQFTDGDPANGIPASLDPAEWANAVTNEILNVLAAASITPDETKTNQLVAAIQQLAAPSTIGDATDSTAGLMSAADKTKLDGIAASATANSGTVTAVTVAAANGVSATVANQGTTPELTFSLGDIEPTSVAASGAITCTTLNATASDRRLKRNIERVEPRPLHRSVPLVRYTLRENGWCGIGSIAQVMQMHAPEHVGTFDWHGKPRLSLNYAGAAYEQALWAGREVDRQAKLIARLEARLAKLERRA